MCGHAGLLKRQRWPEDWAFRPVLRLLSMIRDWLSHFSRAAWARFPLLCRNLPNAFHGKPSLCFVQLCTIITEWDRQRSGGPVSFHQRFSDCSKIVVTVGIPIPHKPRFHAGLRAVRQSNGFIVGNRKPVLCIPPQVPISSALPGSWAIMFLYCFIIFHRHFLNWCKIRCKLTYPDLPLKINEAGHFSFLRSFIVNIHCCRDIRMPHDFLNNLEIFLVLAKTSAKCMP